MSEHADQLEAPQQLAADAPAPEEKAAAHSRRVFLFKLAVALNAAVGAVLAVPLLGYLLGPTLKKNAGTGSWIHLGSVDDFLVGETRLSDFRSPVATFDDGDTAKTACWVRRISAQQFQVFRHQLRPSGMPGALVRPIEALPLPLPRRRLLPGR